jgi:hypothetical protein
MTILRGTWNWRSWRKLKTNDSRQWRFHWWRILRIPYLQVVSYAISKSKRLQPGAGAQGSYSGYGSNLLYVVTNLEGAYKQWQGPPLELLASACHWWEKKGDRHLILPVCVGMGTSAMTQSEEILQRSYSSRTSLTIPNIMSIPTPLMSHNFMPLPWK